MYVLPDKKDAKKDMSEDKEFRFMTYADAAQALSVKIESVQRRARNRKWPKKRGNDGLARVGIPIHLLDTVVPPETDIPPAILPALPPDSADDFRIKYFASEAENRQLRERLDDLKADRDAWRNQAQQRRRWWPF
jgi:hypothetical protein